ALPDADPLAGRGLAAVARLSGGDGAPRGLCPAGAVPPGTGILPAGGKFLAQNWPALWRVLYDRRPQAGGPPHRSPGPRLARAKHQAGQPRGQCQGRARPPPQPAGYRRVTGFKAVKKVEVFTDGACRGNPGPGGWGALLRYGGKEKSLYGGEAMTTNNRMELTAAIEALKALRESCEVVLTTDSQYVRQGITQWIAGWKQKGWRTAARQPVKNVDLWQALDEQTRRHQIDWRWVKGHSGHRENEIADCLANRGIDEL